MPAVKMEKVDLNPVFSEILKDLEKRLTESTAKVEVGSLPVIFANRIQIRQLFQNLVANSLKFSKKGEIPHIVVRSQRTANQQAQILIQDNGIGFDEKYLDRIFKPFQRLHGRKEYEGSGIGLAICQKVVEQHGGKITAKSEPGKGATFIVTLPMYD